MNPTHTYMSAGTFNVQLVVGVGVCSDTAISSVIVNDTTIAIEEISVFRSLSIFPNPSDGIVHIKFDQSEVQLISIEVYDVAGHLVFVSDNASHWMGGDCIVDLSKKSKGTYVMQIVSEQGIVSKKINIAD